MMNTLSKTGVALTVETSFSRTTSISIEIVSSSEVVWALLTNGSDYVRWNSTITSLEGEVETGNTIKLKGILNPQRTFKLKIGSMVSEDEMKWTSGMTPFFKGVRTYTLMTDGSKVLFTMTEIIKGVMYPMAAGSIPSFDKSFEQFAHDLKVEAEIIQNISR